MDFPLQRFIDFRSSSLLHILVFFHVCPLYQAVPYFTEEQAVLPVKYSKLIHVFLVAIYAHLLDVLLVPGAQVVRRDEHRYHYHPY